MKSPTKQSLASPQLQVLLIRAEAVLAQPENKTPGQLAAAERVKRAVIARSNRLTQDSNPSSPASRGLPQSNFADVSELPPPPHQRRTAPSNQKYFRGHALRRLSSEACRLKPLGTLGERLSSSV